MATARRGATRGAATSRWSAARAATGAGARRGPTPSRPPSGGGGGGGGAPPRVVGRPGGGGGGGRAGPRRFRVRVGEGGGGGGVLVVFRLRGGRRRERREQRPVQPPLRWDLTRRVVRTSILR